MAPESQRVLDEYDFDLPARRGLELEDEQRRSSPEPPPPASLLPRTSPMERATPLRSGTAPSARETRRTLVFAACFVVCALGLVAATGLVIALLAPA
jgi:hypothetical protein